MTQAFIEQQKWLSRFATFHGIFYLITGVWPLADIESFLMITGPKVDIWLVRTVGLLIAATGIVLLIAVRKKEITVSIAWLAILNATFLAGVDIFYVQAGVISRIYLLDAAVEISIVAIWFYLFPKKISLI
jgi:hypothetical protein